MNSKEIPPSFDFPVKISSIRVQKKNTNRFSIYGDEEYLVGVSDHSLVEFKLAKGMIISEDLFEELRLSEEKWAIREYLVRILGRRDHSRNELYLKAIKKGYTGSFVNPVLDELEEKKYINHEEFAKKFVHDKFEFNKWGIQKIKNELRKKGISNQIIENALEQGPDKSSRIESMLTLVRKQKKKFLRADSHKRKKKIFDYLIRKGYDSSLILAEIEKLNSIVNDEHHI